MAVNTTLNQILFLLQEAGLTAKEAAVYLALADMGKATAQIVAKRTNLARTTAYFILKGLADKGVVILERKKATSYFVAQRPESVIREIKEQQLQHLKRLKAAEELEKLLPPFFNQKPFSVPTLQFYEGVREVRRMLNDSLASWIDSLDQSDNTWWGYQDRQFVIEHRSWLEDYWAKKPRNHKIKIFSNESNIEKVLKIHNRTIRPLPTEMSFESTLWVVGEFLVVIAHHNRPQYAFQIRDKTLASNMRGFLSMMWQLTYHLGNK